MVRLAPKLSLRTPSCCNVDVVKGGAGLRLRLLFLTDVTVAVWSAIAFWIATASASQVISSLSPFTCVSSAVNSSLVFVLNCPSIDQYSWGTKACISRSRSQIRRTATDWTRPALNPLQTFFHNRGLNLYPTIRSNTRRACWASTMFISTVRGCSKASATAVFVISLKVIRQLDVVSTLRMYAKCQEIASPSRSGSVASNTALLSSAWATKSSITFLRATRLLYRGVKSWSMSIPIWDLGKSRRWPILAFTI